MVLRLSALVVLQIHSLNEIFHSGHRDSLLYIQFLRAHSLSIFILHTNYQGVGPTCHNFFSFLPLTLSPSFPPISLRHRRHLRPRSRRSRPLARPGGRGDRPCRAASFPSWPPPFFFISTRRLTPFLTGPWRPPRRSSRPSCGGAQRRRARPAAPAGWSGGEAPAPCSSLPRAPRGHRTGATAGQQGKEEEEERRGEAKGERRGTNCKLLWHT